MADRLMLADLLSDDAPPPKIDTTVAHIARVYDYWLGGKDHFAVDRAVGDKVLEIHPETVLSVRANRAPSPRRHGSCTPTTTRSCWRTRAPC